MSVMSGGLFGEYQSQTTRQLAQINSSKYPDTNKDFEANIRRINSFIDYIAQYLTTMQKGVDQANADTITRMRDMVADFTILLGGGELLYGIDLGDLQYFLPALGAIFGLDADTPFPINLFNMAEKFFLGYVVPLDAFGVTIQDIINGWAVALGLDPEFVAALNEVMDAMIELGTTLLDILNDLFDLLDILGISTDGFGPFADLWHVVTQLLGEFDLATLGDLADPVLHALAPWVHELAQMLNQLNSIIGAFSGGLTDLQGVLNFAGLFTPFTDLMSGAFDPLTAWGEIITGAFNPLGLITSVLDPFQPLNAGSLYGLLPIDVFGGVVPLPFLSDQSEELIVDPDFLFDETVVGDEIWVRDALTTYLGGNSVKVIADGTIKELYSNKTRVTPGQTIVAKAAAKWSALTGSGSPIKAMLTYFLDDTTVSTVTIESVPLSASGGFTDLQDPANHVVPAGVNKASLRFVVDATATAGNVWFAKPSMKIATDANRWADLIGISGIWDTLADIFTFGDFIPGSGLGDVLAYGQTFAQIPQSIINSIWQGLFSAIPSGNVDLVDIISGLQNIPPLNVLGIQGGTIVDTISDTINTLFGGFAQLFGVSGKSILDVASQASDTVTTATTALELGEWTNALVNVRNNKSLMEGMDETTESNFLLSDLFSNGADPIGIVSATSASYPVAYWRAKELAHKGVITWFGKGLTNITALYIDIYRLNFTTNQSELLLSSTDQSGQLTASWGLMRWIIPTGSRFDVTNGDVIGVSWRVVGTGTHSIAGKLAGSWLPADTAVTPQKPASIRTGTGNVAFGAIVYSNNVPWFGIGIATGDAPLDYHAPRTTQITDIGAFTYDVPDWATHVDEIKLGGGGGGEGGDGIAGISGKGGSAGSWHSLTLVRGTDFGSGTGIQLTGVVGSGGAGGNSGGVNGTAGSATTRAAISGGAAASSAAGGAGGSGLGTPHNGGSPGVHTFNSTDYVGGAGGTTVASQDGGAGQTPGGAGAGGPGGLSFYTGKGGPGARGGAWYVARQVL